MNSCAWLYLTLRRKYYCTTGLYVNFHSNSSTLALKWEFPRCHCTGVTFTARLAPSAAWRGTLTAPGTAPSVPATSPRLRGKATGIPNPSPQGILGEHHRRCPSPLQMFVFSRKMRNREAAKGRTGSAGMFVRKLRHCSSFNPYLTLCVEY